MSFAFKAMISKPENPYLSRIITAGFTLAILGICMIVDDLIQVLLYCVYALIAVIIAFVIYTIYYKTYGHEYDIDKVLEITNEGLKYNNLSFDWNKMKFIQVKYRSHYVIQGKEFNEINEFQFDYMDKHYLFHFKLEGEEDLQRYLQMLELMYSKNIEFIEEVSTIGYTKMMQAIEQPIQ